MFKIVAGGVWKTNEEYIEVRVVMHVFQKTVVRV